MTCRPDIGFALITLAKFSATPSEVHYQRLKGVALYLRNTQDWGIHYWRSTPNPSLPLIAPLGSDVTTLESFPALPTGTTPSQLIGYVAAAYANDLRKRRSTTGYAFTLAGGAIAYRSKTQPTTATSSTETEFIAAVAAAKIAKYLRSILAELGFPQTTPTPLYEDNVAAIKMINASRPLTLAPDILTSSILPFKIGKKPAISCFSIFLVSITLPMISPRPWAGFSTLAIPVALWGTSALVSTHLSLPFLTLGVRLLPSASILLIENQSLLDQGRVSTTR